jgi:hypothetical protein
VRSRRGRGGEVDWEGKFQGVDADLIYMRWDVAQVFNAMDARRETHTLVDFKYVCIESITVDNTCEPPALSMKI